MFRPCLARFGQFKRDLDPLRRSLGFVRRGLGHVWLGLSHLGEVLAYLCKDWDHMGVYWLELSQFR